MAALPGRARLPRRGTRPLLHRALPAGARGDRRPHHRSHHRAFHRPNRVACHVRDPLHHRHTTVSEHMPSAHRRHADWTPTRLRREAEAIGPSTIALVESILAPSRTRSRVSAPASASCAWREATGPSGWRRPGALGRSRSTSACTWTRGSVTACRWMRWGTAADDRADPFPPLPAIIPAKAQVRAPARGPCPSRSPPSASRPRGAAELEQRAAHAGGGAGRRDWADASCHRRTGAEFPGAGCPAGAVCARSCGTRGWAGSRHQISPHVPFLIRTSELSDLSGDPSGTRPPSGCRGALPGRPHCGPAFLRFRRAVAAAFCRSSRLDLGGPKERAPASGSTRRPWTRADGRAGALGNARTIGGTRSEASSPPSGVSTRRLPCPPRPVLARVCSAAFSPWPATGFAGGSAAACRAGSSPESPSATTTASAFRASHRRSAPTSAQPAMPPENRLTVFHLLRLPERLLARHPARGSSAPPCSSSPAVKAPARSHRRAASCCRARIRVGETSNHWAARPEVRRSAGLQAAYCFAIVHRPVREFSDPAADGVNGTTREASSYSNRRSERNRVRTVFANRDG